MAELYHQFLLKLVDAHKKIGLEKPWSVYENVFGKVKGHREFIFIRELSNWSELDNISKEDPISKIMADAFGENEAMQWMSIVQKAVATIETNVLSKFDQF